MRLFLMFPVLFLLFLLSSVINVYSENGPENIQEALQEDVKNIVDDAKVKSLKQVICETSLFDSPNPSSGSAPTLQATYDEATDSCIPPVEAQPETTLPSDRGQIICEAMGLRWDSGLKKCVTENIRRGLPGYPHVEPIVIDFEPPSSEVIDHYQIKITYDTASKITAGQMRSDCYDIVFTDSDGQTEIPHWIKPGTCNTSSTEIWVRVPDVPLGGTKTIYMYYGKMDANENKSKFWYNVTEFYPNMNHRDAEGGVFDFSPMAMKNWMGLSLIHSCILTSKGNVYCQNISGSDVNTSWHRNYEEGKAVAVVSGHTVLTSWPYGTAGHNCILAKERLANKWLVAIPSAKQGDVYCWGKNNQRQSYPISSANDILSPQKQSIPYTSNKFNYLSAGDAWSCALAHQDYYVYCWGRKNPKFIYGTTQSTSDPYAHTYDRDRAIGLSFNTNQHLCVLKKRDRQVDCFSVINGDFRTDRMHGTGDVASGVEHNCAADLYGDVYCWGKNTKKQLGNTYLNSVDGNRAVLVLSGKNVIQLAASDYFTCALTIDGDVWCWGDDSQHQVNPDGRARNPSPVGDPVKAWDGSSLGRAVALIAGGRTVCVYTIDDTIWCWGQRTPIPSPFAEQNGSGRLPRVRISPNVVNGEGFFNPVVVNVDPEPDIRIGN